MNIDRGVQLVPRADLRPNELAVSSEQLALILANLETQRDFADTPALRQEILESLTGTWDSPDDVDFAGFIQRGRIGAEQTVDPIESPSQAQELEQLAPLVCSDGNQPTSCNSETTSFSVSEFAQAVKANTGAPDALSSCAEARTKFRQTIETDRNVIRGRVGWRNQPDALNAASLFDSECLDDATLIDKEVLRNFAVIRMPHSIAPFCGAYRISPDQFLTAMHCFQKKDGRIARDRLRDAQLFLFDQPTTAIGIRQDKLPAIEDRSRIHGVRRQIPAIHDFIVLTTDNSSLPFRPVAIGPNRIGAEAILLGYFHYLPNKIDSASNWVKAIRKTKKLGAGYCRLNDISVDLHGGACISHSCQAIGGFSGSPVLQRDTGGKLVLVGVHVAKAESLEHHCGKDFSIGKLARRPPFQPIKDFSNIAAHISSELLSAAGWLEGDEL